MTKTIIGDESLPFGSNFMEAEKTARVGDLLKIKNTTYKRIDGRKNKGDRWTLIESR